MSPSLRQSAHRHKTRWRCRDGRDLARGADGPATSRRESRTWTRSVFFSSLLHTGQDARTLPRGGSWVPIKFNDWPYRTRRRDRMPQREKSHKMRRESSRSKLDRIKTFNMTPYYPVHYETQDSVIRVKAEEDHVNFIYQFVKDILKRGILVRTSTHLHNSSKEILIHTSRFITGPPIKFPNYGDFSETFVMKTCNFNVSTSPWLKHPDLPNVINNLPEDENAVENGVVYEDESEDEDEDNNRTEFHPIYLDLEFHTAVYPIRVSIYEVYNPGYITKILAKNSDNQWYSLWSGPSQTVPLTSRIFSPPLQTCNFKTKMLRLRFKNSIWDYKTKLDAVMLIGTTELIIPKNIKQNLTDLLKNINRNYPCHWDIHNLTPDSEGAQSDISNFQKNFSKYCTIRRSDSVDDKLKHNYLVMDHLNCEKLKKVQITKDPSNEFKEQQCCSFSSLPDDVILIILEILDLRSMCRMSRVNKRLNNLTWHPSLFKRLNLRYLRHSTLISVDEIIFYFTSRCKYLQQLDLTSTIISKLHFTNLLNIGGNHLTHLRLRNCLLIVDDFILSRISSECKNLKVLEVSYCNKNVIANEGLLCLKNLEFLEELNFEHANIGTRTLCKILQKNRRMRDLNLNWTSFRSSNFGDDYSYKCDLDEVMIQLRDSCPDLEAIGLEAGTITSRGIDALAECKNLRKLNIIFLKIDNNKHQRYLYKLFSSCRGLEEIYLSCLGVSNDFICTVHELSLCKNLKQIFLVFPPDDVGSVELLVTNCPKLKTIHVQCCMFNKSQGFTHVRERLREKYPHVSIVPTIF